MPTSERDFFLSPEGAFFCITLSLCLLSEVVRGMVGTILGPMQPYFAMQVGVDIAQINFLWTALALGFTIGSFVSACIFRDYLKTGKQKNLFLASSLAIFYLIQLIFPFLPTFTLLLIAKFLDGVFTGCFLTPIQAFIIYMIGPIRCRPFIMSIHALIGAGYLFGTLLCRPFLPQQEDLDEDHDFQSVCYNQSKEANVEHTVSHEGVPMMAGLPSIYWPFIIVGVLGLVCPIGLVLVAFSGLPMPVYKAEGKSLTELDETSKKEEPESDTPSFSTEIRFWKLYLCFIFIFYFVSCGTERIFQSMVFTFGLCGPLKLDPTDAAWSDSFYNGAFMIGRLLSTPIAIFVSPRNILIVSLTLITLGSLLCVTLGGTSAPALYTCSALIGFSVSWHFGSGVSWTAQKMDITGPISSVFAVACGIGSLSTPPIISYLFVSDVGPMSFMYMVLGYNCVLLATFAVTFALGRIKN